MTLKVLNKTCNLSVLFKKKITGKKKLMDARTICIHFFVHLIFFIYLCIMKEGRAIRDKQIKVIKTILKESNVKFIDIDTAYRELKNAIIKIVNVRKYENKFGNAYSYEVDVVVDMRNNEYYFYSNRYCNRYKVRCNGYYRRKIAKTLEHEFKYFGFDTDRDELVVKKITYKEID